MKIASKVKNKHKQYPILLKTEQSLQYGTLTIWHKNISQQSKKHTTKKTVEDFSLFCSIVRHRAIRSN